MCGLTGYISNNITKQELQNSVNELKHRGPDNQAIWIDNGVGLGHSRLRILDLSDSANQPLISHSGRYIMVYNGEVYNFGKLADKYKINAKTTSDSEIILELFINKGAAFVNELNGMFVIAIFDKLKKELYLFRDRLGIKPLFYFFDGKNFAFASEIKALLQYDIINKNFQINTNTVSTFLHLGYIPQPNTFFENINKFPAGEYAIYSKRKLQFANYWNVENIITNHIEKNEEIAKAKLKELIISSVQERMISDVPLGTFLSGGIDSSLVTAVAQSLSKNPIKTFSIGFEESKFNESDYAKKVAEFLKTDHHEFIVSQNNILELIDDYFTAYDEPFADSSGFPTMLVSKLTKQFVTVALSGDGGDELFHGYGMYRWANRLNNPFIKTFKNPIASTLSVLSNKYKRASTLFQYPNLNKIKSHIFSQEQYFFSEKELLVVNSTILLNEVINCTRKLSPAESQSIFDINNYLKDDLLVKVDRASMRSALEVRVPLLDHKIVEFALNLSPSLKIKNNQQKYLLKQVLYDYIPKQLFERPKWGFSIPLEKWLQTDLKYLLEKYTSKNIVEKYNVINYDYINKLKARYLKGQTFLYNRLWLIIVLHKNLEKYKTL